MEGTEVDPPQRVRVIENNSKKFYASRARPRSAVPHVWCKEHISQT